MNKKERLVFFHLCTFYRINRKRYIISLKMNRKRFVISLKMNRKKFVISLKMNRKRFVISLKMNRKRFVISLKMNRKIFVISLIMNRKRFVISLKMSGKCITCLYIATFFSSQTIRKINKILVKWLSQVKKKRVEKILVFSSSKQRRTSFKISSKNK